MRAFVTGAGGFVGANLVRRLASDGHDVTAVVRPGGDPWRLADAPGERAEVDLADSDAVRAAVLECQPEAIFHLAAHGAYSWQSDFRAMVQVNVECTEALLRTARELDDAAVLVHAGSSSEYGYKDHAPSPDERVDPNSHYAVAKAAGTHLCRLAAGQHGQRAVTLRLYSAYGPWEEPNRLMPTLVRHALAGGWPPLVAPDIARDFVWVDDVCDAFVRAASAELEDPGAVFNVASGRQTTLREVVEVAREAFAVPIEPDWGTMQQRGWDTTVWVGDVHETAQTLGWQAETSLRDGLLALGEWVQREQSVGERYGGVLGG